MDMYTNIIRVSEIVSGKFLSGALSGVEGALVIALCGGAFLFFGVKLYRILAVLAGMFTGAVIGNMLGEILKLQYHIGTGTYSVIPALAGAIILGLMAVTMTKWALAILFGAGAFYVAFLIGGQWGLVTAIAAGVCSYIFVSYFTIKYFSQIIMIVSALFGVILLRVGMMGFLSSTRHDVYAKIDGHYELTLIILMILFFAIGFFFQSDNEKSGEAR